MCQVKRMKSFIGLGVLKGKRSIDESIMDIDFAEIDDGRYLAMGSCSLVAHSDRAPWCHVATQ